MNVIIRHLIQDHGRLPAGTGALRDGDDLYAAGLTSFAAVQLMLAIEERFDVEFPESMLNRRSFASIAAIAGCLWEIGVPAMGAGAMGRETAHEAA